MQWLRKRKHGTWIKEGGAQARDAEAIPIGPRVRNHCPRSSRQTCQEGVVADAQIGEAEDPLTVYIAMTRVRDLIYRPFDAAPFQKGSKLGREPRAPDSVQQQVLRQRWQSQARKKARVRMPATGQIDHRTVCGNRFYVSAGRVKQKKKNAQKTIGKK